MNWNELKAKIPTTIRYSIALSNYYCVEREWALRAILISSKFCAGLSKCRIDTSNGWVEMLNSYICIVDQPSSNKTGAINMISELLSSTYQLAQLVQTQRLNEASAQTPPDWVTWKVNHFTEEIDTKTETDLQDVLSSFSNTSLSTEEISMSQEQHNQLNEDQAQTDIISQADMLSQPAEDSDDDSASLYEDDPYRPRYCVVENQESFSSPGKTYNFRPTSMTDVRVNMADYPVRLLKIDELPNLVSALKSNSPLEYLIEAKQGIAMAAIIEEENSRKKIKKVAEKTNLNIITSCQYLPFVLFLEEYAASGLSLRFEYILAPSHSKKTHERYIGPELNFYDMLKKIFSKIFLSHHFCPNGSPELLNLEHKYRLPISIEEQSRSHYTHTAYLFVKLASSTKPVNLLQTGELTLLKDLITRECQCGIREKQVFSQLLLELGKLHSVGDWDLGLSHEDFEQSIKKVSVEDFALRVLKACAIPCNSLKVQYGENLSKYEVVEYKDSIFFQDIKGKENSGDVLSQFDKEIDELVGSKRLPRLTRGFLGKSSGKVVSNAVALELIERANTMTVKELLHCKTEISTTSVEAAIMIQQIQNERIGRVDCELLKRESKLNGVPEKYKINKQTNLPWLVMKKASSVQNNVLSAVPTLLDPECNRDNAVNIILYPGKNVPLEYAKVLSRNCTQQDFQKMGCELVNAGLGKFKKVPYHAESVRTSLCFVKQNILEMKNKKIVKNSKKWLDDNKITPEEYNALFCEDSPDKSTIKTKQIMTTPVKTKITESIKNSTTTIDVDVTNGDMKFVQIVKDEKLIKSEEKAKHEENKLKEKHNQENEAKSENKEKPKEEQLKKENEKKQKQENPNAKKLDQKSKKKEMKEKQKKRKRVSTRKKNEKKDKTPNKKRKKNRKTTPAKRSIHKVF